MGAPVQIRRLQRSLQVTDGRAAEAVEVIERHMTAEDRQDVEATVATFTEDCYYRVPGLGMELRGRDQIAGWYRELFAAVPDFRNADERYFPAGDMVFFEARMEGTHLGDWVGWAPTGRTFSVPMLVRIPIAEDGLLEAEIVYFDAAALFMQLGIIPELGSRQERVMQRLHRLRRRFARR
jgi:steroid delta-isomerase-like uncharacterized protein